LKWLDLVTLDFDFESYCSVNLILSVHSVAAKHCRLAGLFSRPAYSGAQPVLKKVAITQQVTLLLPLRSEAQALFVCRYVAPTGKCYNTLIMLHYRVWSQALSLCYAYIRSSGIILIP